MDTRAFAKGARNAAQAVRALRATACALACVASAGACGTSSSSNAPGSGSSGSGTGSSGAGGVSSSGTPSPLGLDATAGSDAASGSSGGGSSGGSASDATAPAGPDAGPGEAGRPHVAAGVYTQHNDNARTGVNASETILTPANVTMAHFAKLFSQPVDGYVYAQPLYVPNVSIPNKGEHDVVYVATENDSVYAFDAETKQAPLWQVSFLGAGMTPVPSGDPGVMTRTLTPQAGITGTPVIDPTTNTLYVVAVTKEPGPQYVERLHALDLATGAEKLGGPVVITASTKGSGANNPWTNSPAGIVTLDSVRELQRPGLALFGGVVYIAFGGDGDIYHYHGWVIGYDATTLAQTSVFCTTPDADMGSIWQGGSGIAVDPNGNLYVESGNGTFDVSTGGRNVSMSVVKLSAAGAMLDWFAPHDAIALSAADVDLGSSGPMILPDLAAGPHPHLMIGSGKPGYLYLLDRDQMGHINAADDTQIVQKVAVHPNTSANGSGIFATPVYWNGYVYATAVNDKIMAFSYKDGVLSTTPVSQTLQNFSQPGALIDVSSNGTTAGILWAAQGDGYQPVANAVLHAYDATDLTKELWNSSQAPAQRDQAGRVAKYAMPTVINGHVYFGTQTELDVYGVLP